MKIIAIIGSGRRRGNTGQLVALVAEQLQRQAARHGVALEFETLYLGQQTINPCRGCRACFDWGEEKCPYHDDLLAIKAQMKAADGVLVASPVYVDDVSGLTKTWIDRLAHVCHRPEFAGRCAYVLATSGSSPTGRTLGTLKMALRTWGFHMAGQAGFKMGALSDSAAVAQLTPAAAKIAAALFDAIYQRRFARPSFYALMVFKIQQRAWQRQTDTATIDYRYWQDQGWLANACTFYMPHCANPLKLALARAVGAAIAPLVAD